MLHYLHLRVPQIILILSMALPLALVFSVKVSASGVIDTGIFWMVSGGSIAVLWGGLAMYTRGMDRKRQLPDAFMTYVKCGNTCVSMKVNEKADIIWQLLQNDALFRQQTRVLWQVAGVMVRKGFIRMPAVLLGALSLVLLFSPESVIALMAGMNSGQVACLVYAVGNTLFVAYVATGIAFALWEMYQKQEGDYICFTQEYQERVRKFAQAQQKSSVAESADSTTRQEAGE